MKKITALILPLLLVWLAGCSVQMQQTDNNTISAIGSASAETTAVANESAEAETVENLKTIMTTITTENNTDEKISGVNATSDEISPASAFKTQQTPLEPAFVKSDTPCHFNGYEVMEHEFTWDDFGDGSGEKCLMILVDAENPEGAANYMLHLPGYGTPKVSRNGHWIYISWGDTNTDDCVLLIFELENNYMAIDTNVLKGIEHGPDSDTVKMPVSVRKGGDPDCDWYYVPLYAVLNEIGGGMVRDAFGKKAAYIFSGDFIQSCDGFWESTDRGEYRADAVIDGKTHSIVSYWTALEFRPDGTFTSSDRYYQYEGDWVLSETVGRYVFWGRMLVMSYESGSEWRGTDYTALAPVKTGDSSQAYVCGWYVDEWDEDYLDIRSYPYYLYGFLTENGEASPRPGKAAVANSSESDDYVLALAKDVIELLKNKDWGAIGHMVHPKQGLTFSPYGHVDTSSAVCLGVGDVIPLWMDDTVRIWGYYDGSGNPIELAVDEYYSRFIMSHDFTQADDIAVDRIIRSNTENNLYVFGNGGAYVDFHVRGGEADPDHTWASLRLVFGWYEGDDNYGSDLYLVAIVHDEWTI